MAVLSYPSVLMAAGAVVVAGLAVAAGSVTGPKLAAELEAASRQAIAAAGAEPVTARFLPPGGWATRHPVLTGGERLDEATRARAARAVGALPGVGGVRWVDGTALAQSSAAPVRPLHCEEDVAALLRARTIRFEESSTRIDIASRELIDEVVAALRPCLGSIISVTGHTDSSGPEPGNIELSLTRAEAVRQALIRRGIPADGLRSRGLGSRSPVDGLEPSDPANRRIEFAVIATEPIKPTPVDAPGPR